MEVVRFRMLEGVDGEGGQWRAAIKELLVERVHCLVFLGGVCDQETLSCDYHIGTSISFYWSLVSK